MKINKNLKKIWKSVMSVLLKVYTLNYKLFIYNYPSTNEAKNYYSQFGQDLFVLKKISNNKQEKVFVDVGANHPINGNNTYLLELNGWKGIAIEPQEKLRKLWLSSRKTKCIGCVVGPENKEVIFIEGDADRCGLSGVEGFNKYDDNNYKKVLLQQKRLDDILAENSIKRVDYLSIDVEGYEMNVLKSIDFSKIDIKLIGIENDLGFKYIPIIGKRLGSELGNNALRKFLKDKGYTYIARIMCDDFFIKIENIKHYQNNKYDKFFIY